MNTWIQVGTIGKAHGLRGHFYLSHREGPLPKAVKQLLVGNDPINADLTLELTEATMHGERLLLRAKQWEDRTAVNAYLGKPVWASRDYWGEEVLWADFVGKPLIDCEKQLVGHVREVVNYGANDSLVVEHPDQKRSLHIPLIAKYVDMSFTRHDSEVRLVVTADFFAEFWNG